MDVSTLEARLTALEQALRRQGSPRRKGFTNQRGAAEYIGRSREYLRMQHKRGTGPRRTPDGRYSYEDLDAFMRGEAA